MDKKYKTGWFLEVSGEWRGTGLEKNPPFKNLVSLDINDTETPDRAQQEAIEQSEVILQNSIAVNKTQKPQWVIFKIDLVFVNEAGKKVYC